MATIKLADGRGELYQWDTGRKVVIDDETVKQVHYQNRFYGRTIDVDVSNGVAIIPDQLLQSFAPLVVFAWAGSAEDGYTKIEKTFEVHKRNKPSDYVYTPTDQMTLQTIQRQIGDLADLTTEAKDTLVAAINEAARSGGGAGSMDLRVAGGYIQYSKDGGRTWENLIAVAELKGAPGEKGADGVTPTIGENGDWYIGETGTGKPSRGEKGDPGSDASVTGANITAALGYTPTNAWYVTIAESGDEYTADKTVQEIKTAYDSGFTIFAKAAFNVLTAVVPLFTCTSDIAIFNGIAWTLGDASQITVVIQADSCNVDAVNILTTDKISQSVDSNTGYPVSDKAVSAAIAGSLPLGLTNASVGQIARITAVDSDGKPTAWSPVDMPSGGGQTSWSTKTIVLEADAAVVELLPPGEYKKIVVLASARGTETAQLCFTGAFRAFGKNDEVNATNMNNIFRDFTISEGFVFGYGVLRGTYKNDVVSGGVVNIIAHNLNATASVQAAAQYGSFVAGSKFVVHYA